MTRALTAGIDRGVLELRQLLRSPRDVFTQLSTPLMFIVLGSVLDGDIPGSTVPMAELMVAGGVATMVIQAGLLTLTQALAVEREDGTLLRVKTLPGGIRAYLIAKTFVMVVTALGGAALMLLGGTVVLGSSLPSDATRWLTLVSVLVLGLVAVAPIGAIIGSLLPNSREALGTVMIPLFALMMFSGIYFPVTVLPDLAQDVVGAFPLKWIAQGVRAALLPDSALAAEATDSWELDKVHLVIAVWAVLGFLFAPRVLHRMTRRESGSRLKKSESVR
ncbi:MULTISPECIES: ABC transporter permease [Streptomyces]|uniref:ABC transporter permease n=1 Tax=Streptomyces TaxID=1883 RepID=UPI001E293BEF|nr:MULTISPECIES: ABC transporter permease [Streptomyces]UFQ16854.1 ABC transporter permease [Streptomyces huasconensis]WCL86457.1 ABC transporter permease [Streptomyces sp. JCM 35825]